MNPRHWVLPLLAAAVLSAGAPREVVRAEPAPVVLSEGALALDEAFAQAFAMEERPERIVLRYANEAWELDWEDWWAYRQGDIDLQGLLAKVRIHTKVEAAAKPAAAPSQPQAAPLPVAWIAGGLGALLLAGIGVGIALLLRKKAPGRRASAPPRLPAAAPPLPPPLPPALPSATGLHFQTGPLAGRSVPLGAGLRLGRERDCQVVLDDPSVSRHHADLLPGPQGWVLRDLNSSNGTSVNGLRIQGEAQLRGGEILAFGNVKARLEV